jgi:hypothetical protein
MILQLYESQINTYHLHADILAISPNNDSKKIWLANNFIQLEAPCIDSFSDSGEPHDYERLDFYFPFSIWRSCPFIYYQRVNKNIINSLSNIIDFVENSINNNCYVYTYVDRYYIPEMNKFHKYNDIHDMFIYGYDEIEKMIYACEYINGFYSKIKISYQDFTNAYNHSIVDNVFFDAKNEIEIISYKETFDDRLDITYIYDAIKGYLESDIILPYYYTQKAAWYKKSNCNFGLKTYENLNRILKKYIDNEVAFTTRRFINAWRTHKILMMERIKYIGESGYLNNAAYIYNQYKPLADKSKILVNKLLKYELTKNKSLILDFQDCIPYFINREKEILTFMLNNLSFNNIGYATSDFNIQNTLTYYTSIDKKQLIEKTIPLSEEKISCLKWEENQEIDTKGEQFIIEYKNGFKDTTIVHAYDIKGNNILSYVINWQYPNFKYNINGINYKNSKNFDCAETTDGLYVNGNGYTYMLSDIFLDKFALEANITIWRGLALSLMFGADKNIRSFHCFNVDLHNQCFKLWEQHEDGYSDIIVLNEEIKKNQVYNLKIIVDKKNIKLFVNNTLVGNATSKYLIPGYLGICVCIATGKFQNVYYT